MLEVLKFIFSSFWIWLGTVILVGIFGIAIGEVAVALRGNNCHCNSSTAEKYTDEK